MPLLIMLLACIALAINPGLLLLGLVIYLLVAPGRRAKVDAAYTEMRLNKLAIKAGRV